MATETLTTSAPQGPCRHDGPEQVLLRRCLAGEECAWDELYHVYQPRLVRTLKMMLGDRASHAHLVDEIAARVWYALVREDASLLARYGSQGGFRFGPFLMGLARIEILRYQRDQRRRRRHEVAGGKRVLRERGLSPGELCQMIDDFVITLTPDEQQFVDEVLLAPPSRDDRGNALGLTRAAVWQRRRRIRHKLEAFLGNRSELG